MLKESRIAVAVQNLEALLREREDPETRRLLTFAKTLDGMVYVSPGPFVMGSKPGGEAEPDELPQRTVTLPGFFIDKTEVTNKAYARFVATGKAPRPRHWTYPVRQPDGKVKKSYDPELDDHPVIKLTWREARAYARWRGGDLPTEAEWEKAARGTDGRTFPWGEGRNVKAHILISPSALRLRRYKTAPVGTHGDDRSPYGVLDMAGNVNEWVRSHLLPYPGAPKGLRLKTGRRVIRGGAYRWPFRDARCAARDGAPESDYSSAWIGFRVVVEVPASLPALR
jgi:formylglycine-generating enzyme required for sulfatase activity